MGRSLPWFYPPIMLASIVVAVLLSRACAVVLGLSRRERLGIGLGAFCGAMIGAKLPFLLADWEGLVSGRAWFDNGKTIVFGLVGGYFGVEVAKSLLGVRVKTGDSFAVPVAAALAIGRLGCFAAGCCHGTVTTLPWAVDFGDGLRRHPTQLYESAFHLTAALVLASLLRKRMLRRQLFKLYLIAYLTYRFLTEFIRPEPVVAFGLTGYQWACLALVPVFVALWTRDAQTARQTGAGRAAGPISE